MKKVSLIIICLASFIVTAHAISSDFKIDLSKILTNDNRTSEVNNTLDKTYALNYQSTETKDNEELENLTKKTTYLLLGDGDKSDESAEDYINRKNDYLDLLYNPSIPKDDNNPLGLDTESQEYKDSVVAGFTIPGMFIIMDDLNIRYDYLGEIKVVEQENGFISRIVIPNILMDDTNEDNPREYKTTKTNLVMYYIFKKYKDEYKLYYLYGETDDDLDKYLDSKKDEEEKGVLNSKIPNLNSMSELYDYSKLTNLSNETLDNIYNTNVSKTMILNSYYDKAVIDSASGFMLTNNILVTSWTFLKDSLINGQLIQIMGNTGTLYELEGIVSISEDADVALLKIKGYTGTGVTLGDTSNLQVEDAVITLGSKTGLKISSTTGIVISTDDKIQSLIPIQDSDVGGPLINSKGEVIGVNTRLSTNSSVSYAIKTDFLKEMQTKLNQDKNINVTSFDKLKEHYYYKRSNDEVIKKDIDDKIWAEYSKIGNIEETIILPLTKVSYKNNILSLRYKNEIADLFTNENFANILVGNLKKANYKEVLNNTNKKIYENDSYEVIIMNEFDYLIVVMVKK